MDNILTNIMASPVSLVGLVFAAILLMAGIIKIALEFNLVGDLSLIARGWYAMVVIGLLLGGLIVFSNSQEPSTPAAENLAIVVGNTQNTPAVKLPQAVQEQISGTIKLHSKDDKETLASSISIVNATATPKTVALNVDKLKDIGSNSTNAKIDLKKNTEEIEKQLQAVKPENNGANYLDAIMQARDNIGERAKIIVIGSGLSDSGDFDFAHNAILTKESARTDAINKVTDKYGKDYLSGTTVEFYGLGDTTNPQTPLSSYQKKVVREAYKTLITNLGGRAIVHTQTMTGDAVKTDYTVSTTDTGCGNIGLVFDDDKIKFNPDAITFANPSDVTGALGQVKTIYDQNKDSIKQIQIEGYTAHYNSKIANLSQLRADAIKEQLGQMGIPTDKLTATGKGYGPFQYSDGENRDTTDKKNRMIRIQIERDNTECK